MYSKIISEIHKRLFIYLYLKNIFLVTSQFSHCPTLTINNFSLTYIWNVVMVDTDSVDTHKISLIFYCPRR